MSVINTKVLTIVAGPNGAGKTTFVKRQFPESLEKDFLNADNFAASLNPEDVSKVAIQAGKQFLQAFDERLQQSEPFIIETTLSGKSLLGRIAMAQEQGFLVRLIFLMIRKPSLCDFRVKQRVILGGHNIPEDAILRRHARGLANLPRYLERVDEYEIYLSNETPRLIVAQDYNKPLKIYSQPLYDELMQLTRDAAHHPLAA